MYKPIIINCNRFWYSHEWIVRLKYYNRNNNDNNNPRIIIHSVSVRVCTNILCIYIYIHYVLYAKAATCARPKGYISWRWWRWQALAFGGFGAGPSCLGGSCRHRRRGDGWRSGVVPCYSERVGRDYFACPRGTRGGFLIALILWSRPNGSKVWSAPPRGRERTKSFYSPRGGPHSLIAPKTPRGMLTHTSKMLANIILYTIAERRRFKRAIGWEWRRAKN